MSNTVRGIDVSYWQGTIDWQKVAGAGYAFAYVRISHGVSADTCGHRNLTAARDAGLRVGAYHYLEAHLPAEPQAAAFLELLGGDPDDLPPVLDLESPKEGLDAGARALAFLRAVEAATGQRPMVYTGLEVSGRCHLERTPELADWPLWVAHWTSRPEPRLPAPWTSWQVWQRSNALVVPGIRGTVDLDVARADWL